MTLSARIQLIEDMIRENRDATIRDYMTVLEEVEKVEVSMEEQKASIILWHSENLRKSR
jgi:hypothetical protein